MNSKGTQLYIYVYPFHSIPDHAYYSHPPPTSLEAGKIYLNSELLYSFSITASQITVNLVAWNDTYFSVQSSAGHLSATVWT